MSCDGFVSGRMRIVPPTDDEFNNTTPDVEPVGHVEYKCFPLESNLTNNRISGHEYIKCFYENTES